MVKILTLKNNSHSDSILCIFKLQPSTLIIDDDSQEY